MNRGRRRRSVGPAAPPDAPAPDFARRLDDALQRPSPAGRIVTVACPAAASTPLLRIAPSDAAVFWSPPDGPTMVGLGAAQDMGVRGPGRFQEVGSLVDRWWAATEMKPAEGALAPPSVFGGFSFVPGGADDPLWADFGDGRFVLPRWVHCADGERATLSLALTGAETDGDWSRLRMDLRQIVGTLSSSPAPGPAPRLRADLAVEPPDELFAALVAAAQDSIRAGAFAKVVLARRRRVRADHPVDVAAVLDRLRAAHPRSHRFAFRPAGGPTFLGGTPESLVTKRGLDVASEALAGTAPRHATARDSDSAALRERLVASGKDRAEHALVVGGVREALSPFCTSVQAGQNPDVRELPNVLHLFTPIRGRLRSPTPLTTLVAALHPTPATGGRPREAAVAWLTSHEPTPRGWYAAPVGRLGADGDGEFCVAIRSALIRGAEAFIYAGAGIVAESDPRAELEEIAAKERTIMAALEG